LGNIFSDNATFAIGTVIGLFGILASHRLFIYRERKKRFDEAATEFRKVFNQAITEVERRNDIFSIPTKMNKTIEMQRTAYLNFRHYLRGKRRDRYDHTWEQYAYDYERQHEFYLIPNYVDLTSDINDLLEFTEYGIWRNIADSLHEYFFRFRPRMFGPDKKTKALVEIFSKVLNDKRHKP
jgi:hypothetical protein